MLLLAYPLLGMAAPSQLVKQLLQARNTRELCVCLCVCVCVCDVCVVEGAVLASAIYHVYHT